MESKDKITSKLQGKQSIEIKAPLESVWEFNQDLTRIPSFHPRVQKVELKTGDRFRKEGAIYTCHLKGGKNNCTEQDIKIIAMKSILTRMKEDTIGINRILKDYIVMTTFLKVDDNTTRMEFKHFYSTPGIVRTILNFLIKPKIARDSASTLRSIKTCIEKPKA